MNHAPLKTAALETETLEQRWIRMQSTTMQALALTQSSVADDLLLTLVKLHGGGDKGIRRTFEELEALRERMQANGVIK